MTTFYIVVIIALFLFWILDRSSLDEKIKNLTSQLDSERNEKNSIQEQLKTANQSVDQLIKYQQIIDAEARAKQVISDAQKESYGILTRSRENAEREIRTAKEEARVIRAEAKEARERANTYALSTKIKADKVLQEADVKVKELLDVAQHIIANAKVKAEEVSGSAYKAMENAQEWERIAKAMKNMVDGYGDRYLKPTYSLLDDLAEEFGHTEAGEKLKEARRYAVIMIEGGMAAKCDYVEAARRETAIQFVLDAFNGKVDSVLSKVKKDNYGTLEQMIEDAYQLVNSNGKAFRNAVITLDYKKARVEELKWAVIVQELKWQEQEEQRRIKEQIREEEKARRDFERAMREAQKEEETLKKLIEKAQKQVAESKEAQRAEYELKLQALEGKLKEAEEKNQRALSMAQQTKSGNVYIISNIGSFGENVYKIGMTRRLEPLDRIRELGDASVPFEFDVHAMIYSEDAPALERELHKKFLRLQINKVNPRKEFFRIGLADIKSEIEVMGIETRWTMTAEARQYRESLTVEEAIASDTMKAKQWEEAQLNMDPVSFEDVEELSPEKVNLN